MGKRVDNDATQEVSSSMHVSDTNPPRPIVSKNDVSMWLSQPVGADDFMAAPKRPPAAKRSINWIVPIGALVFLAIGGVALWYGLLRDSPPETLPAIAAGTGAGSSGSAATGSATGSAAGAATPSDAGVAAADAAATDASVAPGATATEVDAISGADPVVEKVPTKKRPTKKKVTKKKTSAATKKTPPTTKKKR